MASKMLGGLADIPEPAAPQLARSQVRPSGYPHVVRPRFPPAHASQSLWGKHFTGSARRAQRVVHCASARALLQVLRFVYQR